MAKVMVNLDAYCDKYENIRFERRDGILLMQLHTDGKEFANSATSHTELVDAFNNVGADHDNRIVILTGTGSAFGNRMNDADPGADGTAVARLHYEGRRIMQSVLDVEAPMIAAINGPLTHLPPFALTCDITLCSEDAVFSDYVHFVLHGVVPGDGVQTVWPYLLGPNRARYFLLTGQELSAREAHDLGVVNEVLPRDRLLARAWALAEELNRRPHAALRYTRLTLTQRYRRMMLEDTALGYGLEWLGVKTNEPFQY
ncbi:enoyl-CoA hydratase/isomerase family protein [Novosphingobium pentaromativorans]|uniref:Enoyl-CoA hydratase/isomerase n=1 Tax=Novosphingobium pentaromativorans US6-1 TaxID=1088721 RepID=G6EGG6_9SPHN|nr:enoyl-CoA hydratase/isomerase family protein [Novosphingobium pentaromativorans]AIT82114.1 hypothetical protein JI59_21515 [Novosphingobium pentaromativorans US6-1]EHJ59617.1 hypothetical protein NSU_3500 [Novosphingobium pentaromativorans US6-1]